MTSCNMCGKLFNTYDKQLDFGFSHYASYGSGYDGSEIQADFCCACHDKVLNVINKMCVHKFLTEAEHSGI